MPPIIYTAENEVATAALGHALAEILPPGTTVALCGTLGAGKTRLVQAIAEGLGVPRRDVVSPTFVLMQEYHGRRTLYHIDAYRLRDDDEFQQLGPDEYFESDGLVFIEWADRIEQSLPRDYLEICIDVVGAESRRFAIRAVGRRLDAVMHALAARQVF
jgi:tRNA threonylcarbamoyladenosine biosynthesis protein TsaE